MLTTKKIHIYREPTRLREEAQWSHRNVIKEQRRRSDHRDVISLWGLGSSRWVDAPADPAVWSKIQRNWVGILFQLKSEATEEAKGSTACLNLGVTQGMAGGEAEVETVLGERDELSQSSW